ncbi:MAG TPA: FtsX-like permease family protein, partial [Sphingobacteriaceae bacterium]
SLVGALGIFYLVRSQFLQMIVNGHRTFSLEITPVTLAVFVAFAILTGFIAGVLPASYFSKLNPIQTLRNSSASGSLSKVSIRKGLIVVQFALSLVFILGVAIVVKQYRYALNFDHGFQKENILDVQLKGVDPRILKSELGKLSDVKNVSMSSSIPGNWGASSEYMTKENGTDSLQVYQMFVDENYIENLEIRLLAGTPAAEGASSGTTIVVNEAFLAKNGIATPHDALGKSFHFGAQPLTIIGVVKDFHFLPLQERIHPFAFRFKDEHFAFANVKVKSDDIAQTLANIESAWNKLTDQKFEAQFLKHELDDSLASYKSMVKIFGFLGLLAVTISSLGLLAVVISSAESRIREMGIRKVFGANSFNMVSAMTAGFVKLIAIAILIATPVTYFMFDSFFLNMYFYRASIGLGEIAAGIGFLLVLVALIIGSQTFRVIRVNPVETLKYE